VISAVVLAAGAATRFGSPKQLLLLPHVLERLRHAPLEEIVVVAGAYPIEAPPGVSVVDCADWTLGPGGSLRCGLRALGDSIQWALIVLADGPCLDPRAVERVLAARREADFVAASYGGRRGHPAVLARVLWGSIPDDGGRELPAKLIPCDDLTPPGDVDTPDLLPTV